VKRAWAWLCWLALGCSSLPTLGERPETYHLYRTARVAPTEEERLRAAHRYLREAPQGPHAKQLRRWFDRAEERYYLAAFDRLPHLYAYREALPEGPHIEEVRSRIAALEGRRSRRAAQESEEDARIAKTQARLAEADTRRRVFVATFKEWTARLGRVRSWGEPTSELDDETIFAFRLSPPRGACHGDVCKKLLQLEYEVPGDRQLLVRAAVLEVELGLERGLLQRARLSGPELWTRLAEALSLRPLPNPTPEQRADALNRASLLVKALLETSLPAAECDKPAAPPLLVVRTCRGLSARMHAGAAATEDDWLEIAPTTP
jgi:hypothetical protein